VPAGSFGSYLVMFLFLVLAGIGGLGSGSVGGVFLGLLLLGGAGLMGMAAVPPGWKVNARIARRTGR
jgi:hypothetical protein